MTGRILAKGGGPPRAPKTAPDSAAAVKVQVDAKPQAPADQVEARLSKLRPFASYNPGERACFPPDRARRLVESGVAEIKELANLDGESTAPDHDTGGQANSIRPKRK